MPITQLEMSVGFKVIIARPKPRAKRMESSNGELRGGRSRKAARTRFVLRLQPLAPPDPHPHPRPRRRWRGKRRRRRQGRRSQRRRRARARARRRGGPRSRRSRSTTTGTTTAPRRGSCSRQLLHNDSEQCEEGSPSVYDPTSRRLGSLF